MDTYKDYIIRIREPTPGTFDADAKTHLDKLAIMITVAGFPDATTARDWIEQFIDVIQGPNYHA
jgi:hypothetical protein